MDVWTNGSISARDAVSLSAKLIRDHLNIFISLEDGAEPQGDGLGDQARSGVGNENLDKDRKSTRLNSSHMSESRMPSSA